MRRRRVFFDGRRSTRAQVKTGRALINPFDPSHVTIKLTSNRRRWTHIFPKGERKSRRRRSAIEFRVVYVFDFGGFSSKVLRVSSSSSTTSRPGLRTTTSSAPSRSVPPVKTRPSSKNYWLGAINWEIWHHGQYRSMNLIKYDVANMSDFFNGREAMRVGSVF